MKNEIIEIMKMILMEIMQRKSSKKMKIKEVLFTRMKGKLQI